MKAVLTCRRSDVKLRQMARKQILQEAAHGTVTTLGSAADGDGYLTIRIPKRVALRADALRARLLGEISLLPALLEDELRAQGGDPGRINRGAVIDISLHSIEMLLDAGLGRKNK